MALVNTDKRKTSRFNWVLFATIMSLVAAGLVNLYSALNAWGGEGHIALFYSQVAWVSVGLALMLFLAFFDYRLIERSGVVIYVISILLLVAVLIFGKVVAGHKSWISIAGFAFQPSEFAKLALIIMLSKYFSNHPRPEGVSLVDLWQPMLYSALPAVLILLQGDLGSAIFFILTFVTYAWFVRLKGRGVATLVLIGIVGVIFVYFFGLSDYQQARITSFLDPARDARGSGYHLIQSRIAVGSGQVFGKGYLHGNINKLKYLPERHTDFIFSVLAEEWGFIGSAIVLLLFFLLFAGGIEIARKARDRSGLFLAFGIVSFVFWQVVINLCGVLGLMPLTGVTLPFLSYGGSSIIISLASMGILFSIGMRRFLF